MRCGMGIFPILLGFCCVACLGTGFEVASCLPFIIGLAFIFGNVG